MKKWSERNPDLARSMATSLPIVFEKTVNTAFSSRAQSRVDSVLALGEH